MGNLGAFTQSSYNSVEPIYMHKMNKTLQKLMGVNDIDIFNTTIHEDIIFENIIPFGQLTQVISKALSLSGPCFTIESACASPLFTIKLACDYLLSGKSDLFLAGSINCTQPLYPYIAFSILQAYPRNNGESKPFDKTSGGLATAEGAGMIV